MRTYTIIDVGTELAVVRVVAPHATAALEQYRDYRYKGKGEISVKHIDGRKQFRLTTHDATYRAQRL